MFKFIPDVSRALHQVLASMTADMSRPPKRVRRKDTSEDGEDGDLDQEMGAGEAGQGSYHESLSDLLRRVKRKEVTEKTIAAELHETAEKSDVAAALEHVASQGLAAHKRDDVYLHPLKATSNLSREREIYHPLMIFKFPLG